MILNGDGIWGRDREDLDCFVKRLRGEAILGKAIFLFGFSGSLWDCNCFFPVAREAFPLEINSETTREVSNHRHFDSKGTAIFVSALQ